MCCCLFYHFILRYLLIGLLVIGTVFIGIIFIDTIFLHAISAGLFDAMVGSDTLIIAERFSYYFEVLVYFESRRW